MTPPDHDDNDDIGFDLGAWEAPPPPSAEVMTSIADAAIARAREPEARGAIEPIAKPSGRSRKLLVGAVAAAVAMAGVVVFSVRGSSEQLTGIGATYADRPSHVDFGGGTTADLDAGTNLIWVRDGHRVLALQGRGTATWQVDGDDSVRIDAGATVASVSASGASLRVEVEMNTTDVKTVGVTAIGAAAIATLVTVLVYNGRAEVSGNDHAMTVTPGTTVAVRGGEIPGLDSIGRGVAAQRTEIERLRRALDAKQTEYEKLAAQLDEINSTDDIGALRKQLVEKERAIAELEDSVRTLGGTPAGVPTSGCDYDATMKRADTLAGSGAWTSALAAYSLALQCKPSDLLAARKGYLSACRSKNFPRAKELFQIAGSPMAFAQICMKEGFDPRDSAGVTVAPTKPPKPPVVQPTKPPGADKPAICKDTTAVALIEKQGDDYMQQGGFGAALGKFEQIIKCRPVVTKAYLAACRAKSFSRAKTYFTMAGSPSSMAQICMKEGYDPRSAVPPP